MPRVFERRKLETRLRRLEVSAVHDITPKMRRVTLSGPALAGFQSPGHADHLKLFFSDDPANPVMPVLGAEGLSWPADRPRPAMRDYTPRRWNTDELDIDFVLHGEGPAAGWAAQAKIGQELVIGGPRGSLIMPDDFDWYLLAGDETALPAIGRRLEELPQGSKAIALVEIDNPDERQVIESTAEIDVHWLSRGGAAAGTGTWLFDAVAALVLPAGEGHAFVAAEGDVAKAIRGLLVEQRGMPVEHVRASGYWSREVVDAGLHAPAVAAH